MVADMEAGMVADKVAGMVANKKIVLDIIAFTFRFDSVFNIQNRTSRHQFQFKDIKYDIVMKVTKDMKAMKVMRISLHICMSLHFFTFLCILHFLGQFDGALCRPMDAIFLVGSGVQ